MSTRYPGGIITKTPVVPSGPYEDDTAPGIWTLDQQLQYQKAGIWPNPGLEPNFIEDVFSTYLYTGTGGALTINNGIDLATKGGLVWTKSRTYGDNGGTPGNHVLWDSSVQLPLNSNTTNSATNSNADATTGGVNSFTTTGFVPKNAFAGANYATWTFREQPKFFDIVTYTGNGAAGRQIAHNLGSEPGCIIVKCTSAAAVWAVYHRSLTGTNWVRLNTTDASVANSTIWDNTNPTSAVFTVGNAQATNQNTSTYVAYLFAHNAGGFGLTGTDNVISCGTVLGGTEVNLGYEPQWVLAKASTLAANWFILDNMRGLTANTAGNAQVLRPNVSDAETTNSRGYITSTGFNIKEVDGFPYIYIAIRRGPMKVPTSGTSVFEPTAFTSQAGNDTVSSGSVSVVDWGFVKKRTSAELWIAGDRLRGGSYLSFNTTSAEASNAFQWDKQNAFVTNVDDTPSSFIGYSFRRAPGFFDEVCWTGDGTTGRNINHNLSVIPELIILKSRNGAGTNWFVNATPFTNWANGFPCGFLNLTDAITGNTTTGIKNVTSTVFEVNHPNTNTSNASFNLYIAYLFATCPGVSKVGTYTGTGTTLQVNCGFTAGSRFVLIKRTDSTGDWYVWDSARGIVAGNDPYLLLNSTAAEVTGTDYVDTYSAGFEISSTAPAAINANGGSFVFLAIA